MMERLAFECSALLTVPPWNLVHGVGSSTDLDTRVGKECKTLLEEMIHPTH